VVRASETTPKPRLDEDEKIVAEPCPICLEPIRFRSVIDGCFHAFCAPCIKTWAGYDAETNRRINRSGKRRVSENPKCPLCKTSFHKLFHSITQSGQYKVLDLNSSQQCGAIAPKPAGLVPTIVPYRLSLAGQDIIREIRRQRRHLGSLPNSSEFLLRWANREARASHDDVAITVRAPISSRASPQAQTQQQQSRILLQKGPQRDIRSVEMALEIERRKKLYCQIRSLVKSRKNRHSSSSSSSMNTQIRDFNFLLPPSLRSLGGGPAVTLWVRKEMEAALGKPPARASVGKVLEIVRLYGQDGWRQDDAHMTSTQMYRRIAEIFEQEDQGRGMVGIHVVKGFLGELESELRRQREAEGDVEQKCVRRSTERHERNERRGDPISFSISGKRERQRGWRNETQQDFQPVRATPLRHAPSGHNSGKLRRRRLSEDTEDPIRIQQAETTRKRRKGRSDSCFLSHSFNETRGKVNAQETKGTGSRQLARNPSRISKNAELEIRAMKMKLLRKFRKKRLGRYRKIQYYKEFGAT